MERDTLSHRMSNLANPVENGRNEVADTPVFQKPPRDPITALFSEHAGDPSWFSDLLNYFIERDGRQLIEIFQDDPYKDDQVDRIHIYRLRTHPEVKPSRECVRKIANCLRLRRKDRLSLFLAARMFPPTQEEMVLPPPPKERYPRELTS